MARLDIVQRFTLSPVQLDSMNGLFHIHIPSVTAVLLLAQLTPLTRLVDSFHPSSLPCCEISKMFWMLR